MKSLTNDKNFRTISRLVALLGVSALALLATVAPAAATTQVTFTIQQGFNIVETAPLPHVMCQNASAAPGTPAYARARMDLGPLNGNIRYTVWKCYSSSYIYASELSVQPSSGDVVNQKIHGVSDGANPRVDVETLSYPMIGVSCRNLTQGGPVVGSTTETSANGSLETWDCDFGANPPAVGDSILMIIQGTYL